MSGAYAAGGEHRGRYPDRRPAEGVDVGARRVAVILLGVLALAGCGPTRGRAAQPSTPATPQDAIPSMGNPPPAASAGGACKLLDYASVARATGTRFNVAAAGDSGPADSCVLQLLDSRYPDLTLSVVPSKADAYVYARTVRPKGATRVSGLGDTGYSRTLPPVGAAGPAVEVGWLSDDGRIMSLRYTCALGGTPAAGLTSGLVALAKRVDVK